MPRVKRPRYKLLNLRATIVLRDLDGATLAREMGIRPKSLHSIWNGFQPVSDELKDRIAQKLGESKEFLFKEFPIDVNQSEGGRHDN